MITGGRASLGKGYMGEGITRLHKFRVWAASLLLGNIPYISHVRIGYGGYAVQANNRIFYHNCEVITGETTITAMRASYVPESKVKT